MKPSPIAALLLGSSCRLATGCAPEVGPIVWLVAGSTAVETLEELHHVTSARDRGDAVVPLAAIPGAALGPDLGYWQRRLASARAAQIAPTLVPYLEALGIPVPRRMAPPDAVVVSLGTHDLGDSARLETWSLVDTRSEADAVIDAFLRSLPDVGVIWVIPAGPVIRPERLARMRHALLEARHRWPRLSLLDPDPAWFTGTGADGLHYTVEGERALAQALLARLHEIVPETGEPTR